MKFSQAQKDHYRKLAKDQGYRSRAAYKLIEINQAHRLLQRGNKVLDLGCAPGGWLQVAAQAVGSEGRVVGVDLNPIESLAGVIFWQGNIEEPSVLTKVIELLPGQADVLLSDLAPHTSGIREVDHARQIELARLALSTAQKVLKKGGRGVFKVFDGGQRQEFYQEVKAHFARLLTKKPSASRQESNEFYLIGLDYVPAR